MTILAFGAARRSDPPPVEPLAQRVARVAAVAAAHAVGVDSDGRFPAEAVAALKAERLLGVMVPPELGGEGATATATATAELCYALGRACSSTAMIFAMHQVKVACVVRHGRGQPWQDGVLARLADEQMLWASSTTEGAGGGDVRSSEAAVQRLNGRIVLDRDASVISYGAQADAIVTTARRAADSAASDQVLVVVLREDCVLEQTGGWDTLGMRGTCSVGFRLHATGLEDQVLAEPYEAIHTRTMVPAAHLFWTAVWAGIAAEAVERARRHVRRGARKSPQPSPSAVHFTRAAGRLRQLRALVSHWCARFEAAADDPDALTSVEFQTGVHMLKVDGSELAVAVVLDAMRACGLSGYRNDGEASVARQLRDVMSAPFMIGNDRILAGFGPSAMLTETPFTLRD